MQTLTPPAFKRAAQKLFAAMVLSAALAASAAGAHADPLVSPQWLNGHPGDSKLVVLDIRSGVDGSGPDTFAAGRIPGAVHSDYDKGGWRVERNGVPFMVPTKAE